MSISVQDTFGAEQFSQEDDLSTLDFLTDALASSKNNELDLTQIRNIGTGLLYNSPFSAISGEINRNEGFDRIDQAIKIILNTMTTEVPMLPILGSSLDKILFDQIDEITVDAIKISLEQTLANLEPRIKVMSLVISDEAKDENKVEVFVEYRLTNTNMVHKFRTTINTDNGGDVL